MIQKLYSFFKDIAEILSWVLIGVSLIDDAIVSNMHKTYVVFVVLAVISLCLIAIVILKLVEIFE
jgi:hypothetical protein